MGRTHATSGAAVWALIWAANPGRFGPIEIIVGGLTLIGATLWPDFDHKHSTISNTYGVVTRGGSWLINKAAGGHRHGTHSIAGVLGLGFVIREGIVFRHTPAIILVAIPMILAWAALVRLFKIKGYIDDVAPIPAVLALVILTSVPLWYVPYAMVIGCLIHIVGDLITQVKIPIFWPFSSEGYALKLITTDGPTERWVIAPACVAATLYGSWRGVAG